MKQIVVPTDFSSSADNALEFALQTSKIIPAEITLLHSFEVNDSPYSDYVGVNKEFNRSMLNTAHEKLNALKESILEKNGIDVKTIVSTQSLLDSITNIDTSKKVDLIVMGTLGASGIKEKLWGSRTSGVIGKSHVPVMVIPNEYAWRKPEKILLVTNQFEKNQAKLDSIFELAGLYMANMQVAVFTDTDDDKSQVFLENQRKIAEYEKFLKETYKEETLSSAHISGEEFEETLQNFIKEKGIDILVMVTYQNSFWSRLFSPSKTKRMSYHTTIPLLVIPANKNGA